MQKDAVTGTVHRKTVTKSLPAADPSPRLDIADRLAEYFGLRLVGDPDAKPPEPAPQNLTRSTRTNHHSKRKAKCAMGTKIGTVAIGAAMLLGPALVRCECVGAETKAQESLRKGNEAFDKDYLGVAIRHYTEAIRLNPKLAEAYGNRGLAHLNRGEWDKAIADCTEAIRLNPKLVEAYGNRGLVYLKKREYDKAIADCTEAIRLNPKYADAYPTRGEAYMNKGEQDKANADFDAYFAFEPQPTKAKAKRR